MLPLVVFRDRTFTVANLYTLLLYTALGGSLYFLPFMLIDVQEYTPTAAGAAFLPFILLQVVFSRWAGGLVARIGARTPLVAGALVCALAFVAFALPGIGGPYWTTYFPAVLLLGIGGVFFIAPLTTTVFDSSDPALSGTASAINNAIARTAGLLAVAVFGVVLAAVFDRFFDARLAQGHVSAATVAIAAQQRTRFIAGTVPADVPAADRAAAEGAIRSGYLNGFRAVMLLSAGLCLAAGVSAGVGLPRHRAAPQSARA
jgi:MFS family permease